VDAGGDVYLTGSYNGRAQFGTITVDGESSDQAIFVAKFSPGTMQWVWAKGWAGPTDSNDGGVGTAVAVTADGNVYVAGTISVEAVVEGVPLTDDGGSFVAKLGASDGHL